MVEAVKIYSTVCMQCLDLVICDAIVFILVLMNLILSSFSCHNRTLLSKNMAMEKNASTVRCTKSCGLIFLGYYKNKQS